MDGIELAQEFFNYLDEEGLYDSFLNWVEEQGGNREEVDSEVTINLTTEYYPDGQEN